MIYKCKECGNYTESYDIEPQCEYCSSDDLIFMREI